MIPPEEKERVLILIDEACSAGARLSKACEILGLATRTVQRWRKPETLDDKRKEASRSPKNKLSKMERQIIINTLNSPEYRNMTPHQAVAALADKGTYLASEATMYRILNEEGQNAQRQDSRPRKHKAPEEFIAKGPNQVWSWDITYLPGPVKGIFFYLYMVMDIYSRKIVVWQIHDRECPALAGDLIREGCRLEGISRNQLVLHSDNGSPMKGATMLATLQALGVMPSFSRPRVSDDNPFSESLFRTFKYCPWYPQNPFQSIHEAREWVEEFVYWYNNKHMHSNLALVTPNARHTGADKAILANRQDVYERAKRANPERWSGSTRKWSAPKEVALNKKRSSKAEKKAA